MRGTSFAAGALLVLLASPAGADEPTPAAPPAEIVLREGFLLPGPVGTTSRSPVHTDAVEARIVAGTWTPPAAGDRVVPVGMDPKTWATAKADAKGAFAGDALKTPGTYLSFPVSSETERVMMLHAVGHDFVYVNGELRPGDPYGYGWLRLPVLLKKGKNELLFRVSRGRLTARLAAPSDSVFLAADDATLPDLGATPWEGRPPAPPPAWAAKVVVNAGRQPARGLLLWVRDTSGETSGHPLPTIPPLSVRKVSFLVPSAAPPGAEKSWRTEAILREGTRGPTRGQAAIDLDVRGGRSRRVTFTSAIDGSIQYYAVNPARDTSLATILSLHGAGVDALNQAEAYAQKTHTTIVCPTNRRPYGFDWEDWGREDAFEALSSARLPSADRSRTYLTGHSMGGHGTWQVGVFSAGVFAAIGPSAGWASFTSYGGAPSEEPKDDVERMLRRAASPSDTTAYLSNLAGVGVYVLHGDADDNVPITEARALVALLKPFHLDLRVHEQAGAGHWWDLSDAPGADCVDWGPMMEFFSRRRIPSEDEVPAVDFVTPDPAIDGRMHWLHVDTQLRSRVPSRVRLRRDLATRRIEGTTENVAEFAISAEELVDRGPFDLEIDGTKIGGVVVPASKVPMLTFRREDGAWRLRDGWTDGLKDQVRSGCFKSAFDHRFVLVYGTKGTPAENAWAYAKARCDAETWYYRANGTTDVVADTDDLWTLDSDRSVILYGNAETNAAWDRLLKDGPVQVKRGSLKVGARELKGDDLCCLLVRPRPGSNVASVGVVAGTGLPGMRLCDRMPYFTSGVHFPDVTVFRTDVLEKGMEGVRCAGFFGPDWSVETGEFAWRD